MMQVDNKGNQVNQHEGIKKPRDGEWGTLPANAMRNQNELSMAQGAQN